MFGCVSCPLRANMAIVQHCCDTCCEDNRKHLSVSIKLERKTSRKKGNFNDINCLPDILMALVKFSSAHQLHSCFRALAKRLQILACCNKFNLICCNHTSCFNLNAVNWYGFKYISRGILRDAVPLTKIIILRGAEMEFL